MNIRLYNTATRQLETFTPQNKDVVTMYSCGPTVYDYVTIGNLRSFLLADMLKRTLTRAGYNVQHTMNLTDFGHLTDDGDAGEDKIMKGLRREGLAVSLATMKTLTDRYIDAFKEDLVAMHMLPPTTWARASEYVAQQISLVETLQEKGYVYETSDGVYFDVQQFPEYGVLGNVDITKLQAGARVESNPEKRHPADFAVWKKAALGWDSTWGTGFPGWHIECSAMALSTLGEQIDIHTGGEDLQYTHHNAEIAQSECATGHTFVKYWLHNAFVNIGGSDKMSKSKGNAITLRDITERGFTGTDYRYWLLTSHYRSPSTFSWETLAAAQTALTRLKRFRYQTLGDVTPGTPDATYLRTFDACLADDLDTPGAIAALWELVKDESIIPDSKLATLLAMDETLAIGLADDALTGQAALGTIQHKDLPADIQVLITERAAARQAKDWARSDTLRDELAGQGYALTDFPQGLVITKKEPQ